MGVGPLRHATCHFGAWRYRAIHAECAECSEEWAVEQWAPARIKDAGGAAGAVDEVPQTHILVVGDAPVLGLTMDDLRLHPERAALRLSVPKRFAARATAHQVERLELLPQLI